MKKTSAIAILAVALVLLLVPSAFATTVYPEPPVQEVIASEDVVFDHAWFAGSPGLVRAFIQSSSVWVVVRNSQGELVYSVSPPESRAYWQPIQPAPEEFLEFFPRANARAKTPISYSPWQAVVLQDEQISIGDVYTLYWELSWSHQLVDLFDFDGDGKLDRIPPDTISGTVTIEVVE